MAPAIRTFIYNNDFKEKTIIPFSTNGGWPGHVIKDIKTRCKDANVIYPIQIQFDSSGGNKLITPVEKINDWIQNIKKIVND